MKLKKWVILLCIVTCFCMLLCGCGKTNGPSALKDSKASEEQENPSSENEDITEQKSGKQTFGSMVGGDFANRIYRLNSDNFFDFFHYRIESTDQGGEYDVLTYSLELNASSDDISCYIERIEADVSFDVEIKYVKECTNGVLLYDTLTYACQVKGNLESLSGTVDIQQIPVFKRSEIDTTHKKFTVLNVTPHINDVAGLISYSANHTYMEAVTYDTIPRFDIAVNEDCIAVYMIPEQNNCLYNELAVEIELLYTYDTSGRPDPFIMYNEERITIKGNFGGYGQYYHQIENGNGKPTKVVVSVVGISGAVVKSKGYTVYEYPVG